MSLVSSINNSESGLKLTIPDSSTKILYRRKIKVFVIMMILSI